MLGTVPRAKIKIFLEAFPLESTSTKPSPTLSLAAGKPASASPTTSLQTVALSSAQNSGLSCLSAWALYTNSPQPTILKPTAW